jgi:hypothetical protein
LVLEQRGRGQVLATTHELNALNARLRDAAADAIMLTQQASGRKPYCSQTQALKVGAGGRVWPQLGVSAAEVAAPVHTVAGFFFRFDR